MNWKCALTLVVAIAAVSLSSCSGVNNVCTTNCNNSGNAKVTITIFDTPPTGTSVLSFSLPIVGISLTPSSSSSSPVSVYSPSTITPTEITRLETDSTLIVSAASVASGSYTALNLTIGASSGLFVNYSGAPITYTLNGSSSTCVMGAVCQLPAGAAGTISVPINLTLNGNQNQWIGIDMNLNNAIVSTNGISVNFTLPNVFTATTTPRTGIPTGSVDTIEDFTGKVTALSNSSITIQNAITGQTLTAAVNSSTAYSAAPFAYSNCNNGTPSSCFLVGAIVSMYANLASDGTLTATELDELDVAATDEVEGVIYPTLQTNVVGLILFDKTSASGNTTLSASTTGYGTPIFLTANTSIGYNIDSGPLTAAPGFNPVGFSGSGDLLAGQVVRAQVSSVTTSNNQINATASNVLLRWSRIPATLNDVAGNSFTLTNIPAYIAALNTTLSLTPQVIIYPSYTAFDGVTGTTDTGFVSGAQLAIRTLYLNNNAPAFQANKVRVP